MDGFAEVVILDASLRSLDRSFTYSIPEDFRPMAPGRLVRVPFHGKLRNGMVIATSGASEVSAKAIKATLGPGLPGEMLDVARALSDEHLCSLGAALAACMIDRVKAEEGRPPDTPVEGLGTPEMAGPLADALVAGERRILYAPGPGVSRAAALAEVVAAEIAKGGTVIVVTPEADPSGRTALAIRDSCGGQVAWLGSDRSPRLRYREWLRLRNGHARVALGGRGAVLAPLVSPSLFVIDDEGHPALREGRSPRYDALAVAVSRAARTEGRVIAVGVPPSVATRINADPRVGGWHLVAEPCRTRPSVRVIDADILVPTGPTMSLLARAPGRILVLIHRADRLEMVAERIGRLTGRSTGTVSAQSTTEERCLARRPDGPGVVVATSVVAEDHRIDAISDLVILEGDAALADPGYRASEEVFATWWRVLDAATPDRVIAETGDREHPALRALAAVDADVLAMDEAKRRDLLGYPPYRTLIRFDAAPGDAARIEADLRSADPDAEVIGPFNEGSDLVALIVRGSRRTVAALRPVAAAWRADGLRARIEIDPLDLLEQRWRS